MVRRLGCLRGISTLTGFALAVESVTGRGSPVRPSARSSGWCPPSLPPASPAPRARSPRPATPTLARLLVEAAWHHAKPYRVPGKTMRDRWELAPPAARVRGHEGNRRLHQRWQRFNARKKRPAVADVAIARELAGWAWSLALLE